MHVPLHQGSNFAIVSKGDAASGSLIFVTGFDNLVISNVPTDFRRCACNRNGITNKNRMDQSVI